MASEQNTRPLTTPLAGQATPARSGVGGRLRRFLGRVGRLVSLTRDFERSPMRTLADLRPGERAVVARCHGLDRPLGQRLLQLGLLRGREVELLRRAVGGDPIEVRVLGSALSLRVSEARLVELEP